MKHRFLMLLFPLLLGSSGCVTAGLAAIGPIVGPLSALGDRSVERTMPADLSTTWGATVDALARMAVRVEQTERSGTRWQITGTDEGVIVYSTIERVTGNMTKVSVRVEAGSIFADKRTGEELLNQIGTSLASLTGTGPRSGAAAADDVAVRLGTLQRAIERLGTKVDQARDGREARPPTGGSEVPMPAPRVTTSPIITVPASAGLATIPGPPPTLVHQSSTPVTAPSRGVPERQKDHTDDVIAKPLSSVEALRPVEGLTVQPAGQ